MKQQEKGAARRVELEAALQAIAPTTPPSTRNEAPVVAEASTREMRNECISSGI